MKLHLWVECRGHDNMDLFPWVLKLGQNKEYLPIECMGAPYRGAWASWNHSLLMNLPARRTLMYSPLCHTRLWG